MALWSLNFGVSFPFTFSTLKGHIRHSSSISIASTEEASITYHLSRILHSKFGKSKAGIRLFPPSLRYKGRGRHRNFRHLKFTFLGILGIFLSNTLMLSCLEFRICPLNDGELRGEFCVSGGLNLEYTKDREFDWSLVLASFNTAGSVLK